MNEIFKFECMILGAALRDNPVDLEADLEANLCTEYRMRKGIELPSKLNKITTWNDVAKSCPEFTW